MNPLILISIVGLLLIGGPACRQEDQRVAQQLAIEQSRRVQAEQKAVENEKRAGSWQNRAIIAGLGGVVLLIVGAGLGAMAVRDAE